MPIERILISLFLVFHLTMIADSIGRDTPPGRWIRPIIRPYERLLGVYQNWRMFAPNPPRVDQWMELEAAFPDGTVRPLPALIGAREPRLVELRYQRAGKLERNLLSNNFKKPLRRMLTHLCQQHPDARRVTVVQVSRRSPSPAARRAGDGPTIARKPARTVRCPR